MAGHWVLDRRSGLRVVAGLFLGVGALNLGCQPKERIVPLPAQGIRGLFSSSITDLVQLRSPTTGPAGAPEPKIVDQGEKSTLVYTARYAQPQVLKDAITGLLNPDGTVQDSAALNSLVVLDRKDVINNVLDVLRSLDQPRPQLLVEARVVEVTLTDDLEYEIRHVLTTSEGSFVQDSAITLRTPGATPTAEQGIELALRPWGTATLQLDNFIRLLQTRGNANVLSNPNVIVAPGNEASIITGQEVPVQSSTVTGGGTSTSTTFKRVGIKLRVVLQQLTNDTARMEINPEVSTVTGFTTVSQGVTNPIISLRNVSSTVSLKDGEIMTIGGLLQDERNLNTRGIPILQDIPGVGLLFQSRRDQSTKTQLIFFLRVHILPEGSQGAWRLHQPGVGLENLGEQTGVPSADEKLGSPPTTAPEGRQP